MSFMESLLLLRYAPQHEDKKLYLHLKLNKNFTQQYEVPTKKKSISSEYLHILV